MLQKYFALKLLNGFLCIRLCLAFSKVENCKPGHGLFGYSIVTSAKCYNSKWIESLDACAKAALMLNLTDTTPVNDHLNSNANKPKGHFQNENPSCPQMPAGS